MESGNPKLAAMKSILLRAWRERWSDVQWSIHSKRCLPGSPDNAELAELLLQQALVGSSPNTLMLSYLKHAMSTQVVTYNAAIKEIIKYDDLSKMYCVKSLLDLIYWLSPHVSLQGNNEDSLSLCKSVLQLIHWLLDLMHKCLQKLKENKMNGELINVMEKSSDIMKVLFTEKTRALLYIARLESRETYQEIEQLDANIRGMVGQMSSDCIKAQTKENIDAALAPINSLPNLLDDTRGLLDVSFLPLNPSINILLIQEAVLNPTSDIQTLTEQILVIEKSQRLSRPDLYCQLMRTCMLGLIEGSGGQDEIKLSSFTFLKLPQVLVKLIQNAPERDKLANLEAGIEKLISYTPLLDLADTNCNCDCLTFLLGELKEKFSLLNDNQVKTFTAKRLAESQKSNFRLAETQKPRTGEQASNQQGAGLILRAEPTVQSILRTLDADYSKNQESLLGVLCHMLNGKSFELILAAAAATSRLQSFAIKLIKFNEFAKQTTGESGKAAHIRAMLFDITFLMLCHIMQLYGTEIISSSQEASGSFFGQWASKCLPEDGKYKSLDLLAPADPHKVEALLGQLSGGDLKMNLTRWHEVCHNAPFAIHEVLIALEHGVINNDTLKSILENVKGKMCCLPVVVSAWMCSHINMLDDEVRKKPRNILQQLVKVSGKPRQPDPNLPNQYYNDRSHLMAIILHRMIHGVLQSTPQRPPNLYSQPPNTPIYTLLMDTFREVFAKGCIDLKSVRQFEHLLSVGGPKWFCEHLIREVLSHSRVEDLHKGVSVLYGLFHIDLDNLTLCLLHHTLPGLLQASGDKLQLLTDPRGQALAKLTVMCLVVVYRMRQMQKETPALRRGRKRTRTEVELEEPEESEEKPSKIRKLPTPDESLSLDAEGFNLGGEEDASNLLSSKEEPETVMPYNTKDPINKSLVNLFRMANCVVSSKNVTQKTGFIMSLITETINSGPDTARFILQFMPISMVSQLMKCLPSQFSPSILLTLCDVSVTKGRRLASKVISQNARYQKIMENESAHTGLDIKTEDESNAVTV